MEANEFMNKYSKIIDEISMEYVSNYKNKGCIITGGAYIGGSRKCFIKIIKKDENSIVFDKDIRTWEFPKEYSDVVINIANKLYDNLK
ncbi:hypothetical protein FDF95_05900 [Clostridium botulinum]|nr:hypothetical protein [Clostridium botulinum]